MTSNQRSESMNALFDGFVNQKTSLRDFVDQYEKALSDRRRKETKEDFKHILAVFDQKQLNSIPEHYILRRWTIDARYQLLGGEPTSQRKKERQVHIPVLASQVQSNSLPTQVPGICIRDPEVVKTKGRPREASCLKSSLELSQSKMGKQKCGGCGELGHNLRTCKKKAKMGTLHEGEEEEEGKAEDIAS
ncbi:uncharacterized protein LOC143864469 [Tasmannia lanceolata]|uniref:uncharacterized protein LOC143864469 n=1 Tax=Tasmannia lanceolata TaxID=3420 RepID=UPI004063EE3C